MANYGKMYRLLFNSITDAVAAIDKFNYGVARDGLINAQQQAEDIYIGDQSSDLHRLNDPLTD